MYVRAPGWYLGTGSSGRVIWIHDKTDDKILILKLNGKVIPANIDKDGYITIDNEWKKNDILEIEFPMEPVRVAAREELKQDKGRIAIHTWPVVYCIEGADNNGKAWNVIIPENTKFETMIIKY
jgi:DUF1680 family protein